MNFHKTNCEPDEMTITDCMETCPKICMCRYFTKKLAELQNKINEKEVSLWGNATASVQSASRLEL